MSFMRGAGNSETWRCALRRVSRRWWCVLALLMTVGRHEAVGRKTKYSAFVSDAEQLQYEAHYGTQHIVVTEHIDFTALHLDGWWYHAVPDHTLETIQGNCSGMPPTVPQGTPALRELMPLQCVILHDADLFAFITDSPSHLYFAHLYFRVVRSNRESRPIALTLHDGAWAFLDEVTFQGDGDTGPAMGLAVAAKDQAYLQHCMFADITCDGCTSAANIEGTVDMENTTFSNLGSGAALDRDGYADNAAVLLHVRDVHTVQHAQAVPAKVRVVTCEFENVNPYAFMSAEPIYENDPPGVAYVDGSVLPELIAPNTTTKPLEEAPTDRFLLSDHEWYIEAKKQALEVVRAGPQPEASSKTLIVAVAVGVVLVLLLGIGAASFVFLRRSKNSSTKGKEGKPTSTDSQEGKP